MNKQNLEEEQPKTEPSKTSLLKKRSFRYGSMATVFTVVFIAAVVLVNVVLTAIGGRVNLGIDLTSNQTYSLTGETKNYLKTLNQDVTITVLATEKLYLQSSDYTATALKIMQQFPRASSRVSIKFVDLESNPTYASKYSGESLATGDIIVSAGSRYKVISSNSLFTTSTDSSTGSTSVTGYQVESQIDSALQYVGTSNLPKVVFTSGHNEADSTGLQTLMKNNNYTISTQNLSTYEIPAGISTLAIVYPQTDFTPAEINKIDAFLTNGKKYGKNLLVFFDPRQTTLPNLENYVKEWGIEVGKGAIYDTSGYSTFEPLASSLDSTVITHTTTAVHTDLIDSRPLTLLFDSKDIRTTTSLVSTASTARWWNPSSIKDTFKSSASDKYGPFTVLALGTKQGDNVSSNVLVSGSTDMANSTLLQRTDLNNDKVMIDSINYISGIKSTFNITSKDTTAAALNLTTPQTNAFVVIFVVALPLAMLVTGLVIWLRRRHL